MAAPSNIRINPFIGDGGTTNYVDFTEVHIIPAVSPFVVRINEVPQKKDPSNMKVVYVDETTGAPTTTALTEVAATPGVSEFRPDYSTNADDDKDWNTGLIEFSSADAGKSVQISYTGMGTLAGVKNNRFPSWWLDRGDGSDGDFRPTENVTISGLKQYRNVFIPAGVTVYAGVAGSSAPFLKILCQGAFVNKGTITSKGRGSTVASTPAYWGGVGGGGYNGGNGGVTPFRLTEELKDYMLRMGIIGIGAVGGRNNYGEAFGVGGGCIQVVCKEFENIGTVDSSGSDGGSSNGKRGGGGGGGSVMVICETLINKGILLANGGGRYDSEGGLGEAGTVRLKELGGVF